jgi:hypothetical protein
LLPLALSVSVGNPAQNEQPGACVTQEEQSVLLKELGSPPVAMRNAECGTLLELLAAGLLGDVVEHQVGDGRQALTGVLVAIPLGVHAAQGFDLRDQRLSLIDRMPLVLVLSLAMILDWSQILIMALKSASRGFPCFCLK